MEGEAEYAFWHVLARDVAYSQLPRASRATRHVAAAAWIESKAPERVEDLADVLAYHYTTALELARAAGQTEQAAELEAPALRFLSLAGERALGLDTAAALASFERALALTPRRPPRTGRGAGPLRRGRLARGALRRGEGRAGGGDRRVPGGGDLAPPPGRWARSAWCSPGSGIRGRGTLPAEALALLEPLPPGPELRRRAHRARRAPRRCRAGTRPAIDYAERALALAAQLGLPRPARALGYRGRGPLLPR